MRNSLQKTMKVVSLVLVLSFIISSIHSYPIQGATGLTSPNDMFSDEYYEIINEYYNNVYFLGDKNIESLQAQTVKQLSNLGYEAYSVNPTNFTEVQSQLKTDLEKMGITRDSHCIIVITGDKDGTRGAGTSFSYTYNGITYTLRTLTVTAAENSAYGKSSSVNVLSSKIKSVIQSCLNAVITTIAGSINSGLGTVATICGLVIDNFSFTQTSTMYLNCGTNWTRAYTQVYDSFYNEWYSGSCTEYVRQFSYMSGTYYSASTNGYVAVPTNQSTTYTYASYYTNTTWRRDHAVLGYLNSYVYYDLTGSVYYYYNGSLKVTHLENF